MRIKNELFENYLKMADNEEDRDRERREREEEWERKRKEENKKMIRAILSVLDITLSRYRNEEDPVLKYSLLIDKLLLLIEISMGVSKEFLNDETDNDAEIEHKFEKLTASLQKDLKGLMDWIKSPVYSPDHPYGNNFMNNAKKNFENRENDEQKFVKRQN